MKKFLKVIWGIFTVIGILFTVRVLFLLNGNTTISIYPSTKGSLDDRPVTLLFDTGNTNTHMSARYYDRFPSDSSYREGTLKVTQVDRSWETKVFVIEQAKFELCGTNCELSDVCIMLDGYGSKQFDGNLGVDALRQFKAVTFNAHKLYLQFIL